MIDTFASIFLYILDSAKVVVAEQEEIFMSHWTFFYDLGLNKGPPFRKTDGNVNWRLLKRFVVTKSLKQIKAFAKKFNALENGKAYPEFSTKAAVDVWRQLADKVSIPGRWMISFKCFC